MGPHDHTHNYLIELRRIAEEALKANPRPDTETGDLNQLVHEIQVYQIELETQNEEPRTTHQELSLLTEQYEELFDAAPVGYAVLDNNYVVTEINREGARILAEVRKYIVGSPLNRYVSSSSKKELERHLVRLSIDGHAEGCEIKIQTKDPFPVWTHVESTIIPSTVPKRTVLLVAMLDITEKKQKEVQIEQKRIEYTDIVETANSIITKIDRNGRITFLNQYGLDFFGFDRDEIMGKPIIGTLLPEDTGSDKKWARFIEAILANPEKYRDHENENVKADGTPVWIQWRNKATVDADGSITGILGVGRNITEEKLAEEIIKRDNEELEALVEERTEQLLQTQKEMERSRRLADLGRLSSSVAHELRRPLAAIKLSTYNIRKKRTNPEIDKNLNHCEEKIAEADKIISSILKSHSLKKPILQEIDLAVIISQTLDQFESTMLGGIEQEITGTIIDDLSSLYSVKIEADPFQLKEVIYNIVKNACEATGWQPEKVSVIGFTTEESAGFKVVDSDMGIPKEEIQLITEPFYTTKNQGLGLGLTVAQEIIDRHDGTLDIESSVGTSTTVTVTLPKKV